MEPYNQKPENTTQKVLIKKVIPNPSVLTINIYFLFFLHTNKNSTTNHTTSNPLMSLTTQSNPSQPIDHNNNKKLTKRTTFSDQISCWCWTDLFWWLANSSERLQERSRELRLHESYTRWDRMLVDVVEWGEWWWWWSFALNDWQNIQYSKYLNGVYIHIRHHLGIMFVSNWHLFANYQHARSIWNLKNNQVLFE